ncbi:hypothetical protein, partial [Stigmatella aurantiaca]|uniref:hypothetical protein n=1 Tax=Stigmatella aurantiaca TaxID=41 RepID=UPI001C435087
DAPPATTPTPSVLGATRSASPFTLWDPDSVVLTAVEAQRASSTSAVVQWSAVLAALAFSIFFIYAEDPFRQLKANVALERKLAEAQVRELLLQDRLRLAEEQLRAQLEQTRQQPSSPDTQ